MKHIISTFILLAFMTSASLALAAKTKVTLVIEPYPPFAFGKEGEVATKGIAVEVAHEIFRRIPGTTLEIRLLPWKRLLYEVREGLKDGVLQSHLQHTDNGIAPTSISYHFSEPIVNYIMEIWRLEANHLQITLAYLFRNRKTGVHSLLCAD